MASFWVYLTLGVIVALIALGAIAIDIAVKRAPELHREELITTSSCDIECKQELEAKGYVCYLGLDGKYFCKFINSTRIIPVVIPVGASDPESRTKNYIPSVIKVSLGINSTVQWTNVDNVPSSVTSDEGLFDSGPIYPNMTWTYVFDKVGTYNYHSEPHPWMRGQVIVVPIDLNYNQGMPIGYYGGEPPVTRFIFRERDAMSYVTNLRLIDSNTVAVSLHYPDGTREAETLKTGDSFLANCDFFGGRAQIHYLVLETIDFNNGVAELREEVTARWGETCPHS